MEKYVRANICNFAMSSSWSSKLNELLNNSSAKGVTNLIDIFLLRLFLIFLKFRRKKKGQSASICFCFQLKLFKTWFVQITLYKNYFVLDKSQFLFPETSFWPALLTYSILLRVLHNLCGFYDNLFFWR